MRQKSSSRKHSSANIHTYIHTLVFEYLIFGIRGCFKVRLPTENIYILSNENTCAILKKKKKLFTA